MKAGTTPKGTIPNARHAVRDSDRLKIAAKLKGANPNGCYAIWDSDRLKAGTIFKGIISNARHAVRDSDRLKVGTTRVSAIYLISMICTLNGRKASTWILEKTQKRKI